MAPNSIEVPPHKVPETVHLPVEQPKPPVKENNGWHICQTTLSIIGRFCIGIVVGICIAFVFRNEEPFDLTNVHIVFCVVGVSTEFNYLNLYNSLKSGRTDWYMHTELQKCRVSRNCLLERV